MLYPKDCPLPTPTPDAPDKVTDFVLHKLPATVGREIVAKYPVANLPKLGDYGVSEATMLKLMSYVGVRVEGRAEPLMLTTAALINNHTGGWETLARLEWAMLEYNCSFFENGLTSGSLQSLAEKARPFLSQMLTAFSEQSSAAGKPPSEN